MPKTPEEKIEAERTANDNLSPEDREYLKWLTRIEGKAIIPLKWAILVISVTVWLMSTNFHFPATRIFMVFFFYGMFNVAQSYFFYANRVTLNQVKPFCYLSYFIDILFVTILIYLDTKISYGQSVQSDFYILYFLMILRGFALFRRSREAIFASIVISGLFIFSIRFRETSFDFIRQQTFALKFALLWMVGIMSWFIVEMINRQKSEILRIRENLIKAEQFATLGKLAAGVAHEINNPIGIISAYAEYLKKNSAPGDPVIEDYETLHREALRCEKIVSQLLNFANPSAREIIKCDLAELNDEVLNFLYHDKKNQGISLHKDIQKDIPEVFIDPVQFKQALLNIYINAGQSMEDVDDKKIFITMREAFEDNHYIILKIRDNGKGLNKDDIEKAFEPFFTRKKKGVGMGLSITRRIIEGHSGEIHIRNAKPRGAEVEIRLPVTAEQAGTLEPGC